jgi:hypothetical protein
MNMESLTYCIEKVPRIFQRHGTGQRCELQIQSCSVPPLRCRGVAFRGFSLELRSADNDQNTHIREFTHWHIQHCTPPSRASPSAASDICRALIRHTVQYSQVAVVVVSADGPMQRNTVGSGKSIGICVGWRVLSWNPGFASAGLAGEIDIDKGSGLFFFFFSLD